MKHYLTTNDKIAGNGRKRFMIELKFIGNFFKGTNFTFQLILKWILINMMRLYMEKAYTLGQVDSLEWYP